MGRTLPSATQVIIQEEAAFARFRRALRRSDQVALDDLFRKRTAAYGRGTVRLARPAVRSVPAGNAAGRAQGSDEVEGSDGSFLSANYNATPITLPGFSP